MLDKVKLIILILVSSLLACSQSLVTIFPIFLILVAIAILFPLKIKKQRFKPLLLISLLVILFNLLFYPDPSFPARILKGLIQAVKITSLSLSVFIFTAITSPSAIVASLNFLPPKIRLMLTITFSLIPVIMDEADKIKLIQITRGLRTSSLNPFSSIFPLVIPLLYRTLKRAEQIALVLETKNYEKR